MKSEKHEASDENIILLFVKVHTSEKIAIFSVSAKSSLQKNIKTQVYDI